MAGDEPSNETLLSLLTETLGREDVADICQAHFPELAEELEGWSFRKSLRELIKYCRRHDRIDELLRAVRWCNPEGYKRFEPLLAGGAAAKRPGIARIVIEIQNDTKTIGNTLRKLAELVDADGEIFTVKLEIGSVKLTVVMPAGAIERLLVLHEAEDARLSKLRVRKVKLVSPDLRGADLSGAALRGANLRQADLSGANLRGADLSRANLQRANLRRADLRAAKLSGARLSGADLRGADLRGADLRTDRPGPTRAKATIRPGSRIRLEPGMITLRGTKMRDANLLGAKLEGRQRSQARRRGAIVDDARLGIRRGKKARELKED